MPLLFAYDIDTFSHDLAQFINQIEILKKHIPVIYQGIRHFSCQKCSMVKFTMMKLTIFLTMPMYPNPSHAAIKISINATAAEFICKNIFPIPVQIKKIIKNKTGDIQQIYLYQNVCK